MVHLATRLSVVLSNSKSHDLKINLPDCLDHLKSLARDMWHDASLPFLYKYEGLSIFKMLSTHSVSRLCLSYVMSITSSLLNLSAEVHAKG